MFVKLLVLLVIAAVAVAIIARTSSGSGPERIYVVRPADTLWSIAAARSGGDPREAVWKIERRNQLVSDVITPGQRLVLPP